MWKLRVPGGPKGYLGHQHLTSTLFNGVLLDTFGGRREKAAHGVEAGDQDSLSGCAVVIRTRLGVAWGRLKDGVTGGTRHLQLGVYR
jgi:hypothetical protein